ncbi:glycosyltransferase [Mycobacterium phage Lucky2013]|nr:glycosyltransferase [Mycobacterium phage Lucky2013]
MDLSILIPSVHTRWNGLATRLQAQIWDQYRQLPRTERERVEIIVLTDNKKRPIGDKRNQMLALAQGEYVAFVDDDDVLEDTYLRSLLLSTAFGADVITFQVSVTINGGPAKKCIYSKDFAQDANFPTRYERLPNHLMCVKRDLALSVGFPEVNCGEDSSYAKALHPLLKTEHAIDRVLYHYVYSDESTETQKR